MVIAIVATTLNGKIALNTKDNITWGSKEDKKLFSETTKKAGVIIFGKTTFETINKTLPNRKNVIMTFDHAKELNKQYSYLENKPYFTELSPKALLKQLKNEGYKDIFVCGGKSVYTLFFKGKLIDQLWITVEPFIFGVNSIDFLGDIDMEIIKLKLLSLNKINQDSISMKYKVSYE